MVDTDGSSNGSYWYWWLTMMANNGWKWWGYCGDLWWSIVVDDDDHCGLIIVHRDGRLGFPQHASPGRTPKKPPSTAAHIRYQSWSACKTLNQYELTRTKTKKKKKGSSSFFAFEFISHPTINISVPLQLVIFQFFKDAMAPLKCAKCQSVWLGSAAKVLRTTRSEFAKTRAPHQLEAQPGKAECFAASAGTGETTKWECNKPAN